MPSDQANEKSIWVIEEYYREAIAINTSSDDTRYSSKESFDTHMASKPVADLVAYFGANPDLFGGAPDISTSESSSSFTRSTATKEKKPFITYASIVYQEDKREDALEGWKYVTSETVKNEPGTLSYGVYKNKDNDNTVKTVEVYKSEEYFKHVHVPSKAVSQNKEKYGDEIRLSLQHVFLRLVAGYLARDKSTSSL